MLNTLFRYARFAYAAVVLAAQPAPALAATNWKIDPSRTQIAFAIDAVGYPRTEGHFRRFEGRISVDFDRPEKSSVAFHVQSGSVDVGSSSFSDYLRSAAFLDADRFPTIDF
ncbi:MAG: YceI family protein, partial [Roseiarcus sp.]|uniref:YceI family protein n=1 Tax=Roseiarcus sp. TaxID=1969460 RepID=UPI003BB06E68